MSELQKELSGLIERLAFLKTDRDRIKDVRPNSAEHLLAETCC